MSFKVRFSTSEPFKVQFTPQSAFNVQFGEHIEVPVVDYYDGEYSITPAAQEQTIPIVGKTAKRNIVVDAIPADYGRLMWSGTKLTVY